MTRARVVPVAVVAAVLACFSLTLALRELRADHLHGDEVEYLLQARELRTHHDLTMNGQFLHPGDAYAVPLTFHLVPGQRFVAAFMPGQPVLLAVPDGLAGRRGAQLWAAGLWALAGVLLFCFLRSVLGLWPALFATLVAGLSVPLAWHASSLFTEIPALVLLCTVLLLTRVGTPRWPHVAGAVAVLAALPWLHQKYGFLAAGLVLALLLQPQWRRYWPLLVGAVIVSSAGTVAFAEAAFGRPNYLPTPPLASPAVFFEHVAAALFDRNHGIVPEAPVWLAVGAGVVLALRDRTLRRVLLTVVVALGPFVLVYLTGTQFQLGEMAPGRETLELIPLFALLLGVVASRLRPLGWALLGLLSAASVAAGVLTGFLATPDWFYNNAGTPKLLAWLGTHTTHHLVGLFPLMTSPMPTDRRAALLDAGAVVLVSLALYACCRAPDQSGLAPEGAGATRASLALAERSRRSR